MGIVIGARVTTELPGARAVTPADRGPDISATLAGTAGSTSSCTPPAAGWSVEARWAYELGAVLVAADRHARIGAARWFTPGPPDL